MLTERIENRILGALRLRDHVTGQVILGRRLTVAATGARLVRNLSGLYVIAAAAGLENYIETYLQTYTDTFRAPPAQPAPQSLILPITISDPLGHYLPRRLSVALPRDPDPANRAQADSLFQPVEAALYPAAPALVRGNRSSVRLTLRQADLAGGTAPVRGALVRVVRTADGAVLGSGISDAAGEALVIVPGIPITNFAGVDAADGGDDSPVVVADVPARLEVSLAPNAGWPVDPDVLETAHTASLRATAALNLRTGRMERITITLAAN